jgi:SAM-dependent methyltransferase
MKPLYLKGLRQRISRTLGNRPLKHCSFLDVGCANGEYMWAAGVMGFGVVTGVEIDREARQRALRYGEVFDDIRKLKKASYDLIQIKNVLSNVPDFIAFMETCITVMKAQGVILLDVLNQDSLTAFLRNTMIRNYQKTGRFGPLRPAYVINGFNKKSLLLFYQHLGLTATWLKTSYMGSPLVPYAPSVVAKSLGVIGSVFGKGSMLVSEARRTTPREGRAA